MDLKEIYALVDYLVDEKLNNANLPSGPRGLRGQRGFDGKDGQAGLSGKGFIWDEHAEKINLEIKNNSLTFDKLTDDQKESLRGFKGPRGQRGKPGEQGVPGNNGHDGLPGKDGLDGKDGQSFDFDLLSEDQKKEIRGPRGLRGQRGKPGLDGLNGEKGLDGKDGLDGKHFTFEDLTDDQKKAIKGERGLRGYKGIRGLEGKPGVAGIDGKPGIHGLNGTNGKDGKDGANGQDGEDAPYVVDIEIKEQGSEFYFVFLMSDGQRIETNSIDKPAVQQIIQNTYASYSSGEGGGGASELEIYKDNILLGVSESLDFVGDNITVTYDSLLKRSTISVDEPVIPDPTCIGVFDEGTEITPCVSTIDFVGDNVEVVGGTSMADWALLSDVTTLAGYEVGDNTNVTVVVKGQESVSKLGLTRIAVEDIDAFEMVRLVSSTHVAKGSNSNANGSKISGIALNSASTGGEVTFVMFGVVEDASFSFPLLSKLFLQGDGTLGTTVPVSSGEYVVASGESLGTGAIFIKIEEPEGIV